MDAKDDKYKLQILSRAISVLFAFSAKEPRLSLDELAAKSGLNKTSLLRILRTLEIERFLMRSGDHYRLGSRVLELGNVYLSTLSVHGVAQPFMSNLAESCNQTISLAILDAFEVVYIGIEQAQREVGIQGNIGARHPAHATALGKVMLAALSDKDLKQLLEGRELKRLTHRTIVSPQALLERLAQVREQGYAVDDEERGIGIRCVAAPIYNHQGKAVAALSLAGPIFHMTDDAMTRYKAQLLEAVTRISEQLGYSEALIPETA